jgi:hypothetical protein
MREDGIVIDKILLSLTPYDEILDTSDFGPKESLCLEASQ